MVEREQLEFDFALTAEDRLSSIFQDAFGTIVKKGSPPEIEARFYPYAGLSSTIRLRNGRIYVRISDILTRSPRTVLHSLACILIAKLFRKKAPPEYERIYRTHASSPSIVGLTENARRGRGYKITTSPSGAVYDLNEVFGELNQHYFEGRLERPALTWSKERARRILGHHDHVHDTITISRFLDNSRIPRLVVEYVLYHEMLHIAHPPRRGERRTIYHSREFRADESRFEQLDEALKWLDRISLPARRRRKPRNVKSRAA